MEEDNLKLYIKEIHIENFKCFKGRFKLSLNEGLNILVGDNEAGKSTILEAVYIALNGILNGRYLNNNLTQYLFNNEVVSEYISNVAIDGVSAALPEIIIEVFIGGGSEAILEGNDNSKRDDKEQGFTLKIAFDDHFKSAYEALVNGGAIKTLPIEYYEVIWKSFARDKKITPKNIPIKAALVDSSTHLYRSGSDIYINQIIRDVLNTEDIVAISQAHRKLRETFMQDASIESINKKIQSAASISDRKVNISVDLSTKNAWENSLMTYLDDVPFQHIGKGEQTTIKTKLALAHKKTTEANLILLEEPENHLSHSRLNKLIKDLDASINEKQIIIATHSSFVANKLGLESIIFLHNQQIKPFNELEADTQDYFCKLAGYDTLRLLLCKKAILVEGDSDELIVQKAYMTQNGDRLPIDDEIDVISVGTSFLRFLEIAKQIRKTVVVVTDNDGDIGALKKKYNEYLGDKSETKDFIRICFNEAVDDRELLNGKPFNYNTLEPNMLKSNSADDLNGIFETKDKTEDELLKYMAKHKTKCALKIFNTKKNIKFPAYILDAIKNEDGKQ